MAYYNILSSSDDEDIIRHRRPRRFKLRMNYFDDLDDIEFKMRFRLDKNSVLLVLNNIEEELTFRSNRYVYFFIIIIFMPYIYIY